MNKKKCLGCYLPIQTPELGTYHKACSQRLFGTQFPPDINFGIDDLETLAEKSLNKKLGLTGVQPKIPLQLEKHKNDPSHRLTIADLWGHYILKPPTATFPDASVLEDTTMHMGKVFGLNVAKHGLIQLKSGELAYVTRRFDRTKKNEKIATEDFCQLSGLLTESKYNSSVERAGKIISHYSANPGLDTVYFFDRILFSFLCGNADMHLKNFSLIRSEKFGFVLSPSYDLLSTKLLIPEDKEEMALTVNGKKAKLKANDFIACGRTLGVADKAIKNSFFQVKQSLPSLKQVIAISFLTPALKKKYLKLIDERSKVLSPVIHGKAIF